MYTNNQEQCTLFNSMWLFCFLSNQFDFPDRYLHAFMPLYTRALNDWEQKYLIDLKVYTWVGEACNICCCSGRWGGGGLTHKCPSYENSSSILYNFLTVEDWDSHRGPWISSVLPSDLSGHQCDHYTPPHRCLYIENQGLAATLICHFLGILEHNEPDWCSLNWSDNSVNWTLVMTGD